MAKLYCILARAANTAVIFRRGPGKLIRLISWDLSRHTFEPGQWFKGQIYVRKSDLSPDGSKLVYFAAKFRPPLETWIAVSTPPYLTAHVLWEGMGTWNDISLFEENGGTLALATYRSDSSLAPYAGFAIPKGLRVRAKPWVGCFFTLADHERLVRDGWSVASGDPVYRGGKTGRAPPVVYRKDVEARRHPAWLECSATSEHHLCYALCSTVSDSMDLQADWADCRGKEVYFSRGGKLFCLSIPRMVRDLGAAPVRELADFTDMTFEPVEAPAWAAKW
jgi:hypothetical protein